MIGRYIGDCITLVVSQRGIQWTDSWSPLGGKQAPANHDVKAS